MSVAELVWKTSCLVALLTATAFAQREAPPPVRSFPTSSSTTTPGPRVESARGSSNTTARYATKNRKFSIPFSLVSADQVIVEVLLFGSTDQGRTWKQEARADLRQSEFEFVAPSDGEYWFAVQTLNRNGQRLPAKIAQPELIVVVDTVGPTLTAQATSDASGRIIVQYEVRDDFIATDSLAIRLRPSGSTAAAWVDIPAKITKPLSGPRFQDSYAFWPDSPDLQFDLEVSIRDQAGNQATAPTTVYRSQSSPQFNQMPKSRSRPNTDRALDPSAQGPNPTLKSGSNGYSTTQELANRAYNWSSAPKLENQNPAPTAVAAANDNRPAAVEWRSAKHSSSGQFLAAGSTQVPPQTRPTLRPMDDVAAPEDQLVQRSDPLRQPPPLLANPPANRPAMLVSDRNENDKPQPLHSVLSPETAIPPEAQSAIAVSSKRFRLNYQVEAIDSSGVQEVAVWVTRDVGKSWSRLGTAADPNGPFPVEVDGSGLFGFRIVVTSQSGLRSRLPQPGDPADKWVRVDVDPPVVKITGAPYGTGEDAGKLVIQWQIQDDQLALRPITLEYSSTPDGPWTTIEKGVRNTGSYAWAVPSGAPSKIYLRLTARDEAGNQQSDQTLYPIDTGGIFPRGLIRSVEPIKD